MRLLDLRDKDVVNINDGCRIGIVYDVEFDLENAKMTSLVVPGPGKFFGLFGRKDVVIEWKYIEKIGDDTILVSFEIPQNLKRKRKKRLFL